MYSTRGARRLRESDVIDLCLRMSCVLSFCYFSKHKINSFSRITSIFVMHAQSDVEHCCPSASEAPLRSHEAPYFRKLSIPFKISICICRSRCVKGIGMLWYRSYFILCEIIKKINLRQKICEKNIFKKVRKYRLHGKY